MDGMAVIAADIKYASPSTPITLNIVRNVGLGNVTNHPLHSGQASRIPTGGDICLRELDTVVPVEQTQILSKNKVVILSSLSKGFFLSLLPVWMSRREQNYFTGEPTKSTRCSTVIYGWNHESVSIQKA